MRLHRRQTLALALGAAAATAARAQEAPLRVAGNTSTIELAPVLLAADRGYGGKSVVSNGGIRNLYGDNPVDVATNAETQALRESVDHPDLRIILTVSEGLYRLVGRRSSGIAKVADLKGKKIATVNSTSSAFFLHKLLKTAGLTAADVTVVPMFPLNKMTPALKSGEVDAVTIWEPEIETAQAAIGADAIEFSGKGIYRECFNLHARAADLADPAKRKRIVAYVAGLVRASAEIRKDPAPVWPLVVAATKYDPALVRQVWKHEAYPGNIVPDLLEVLVEEEAWVAPERKRTPRSRAELAKLIDASVLKEALARR